ncbi:sulfotransferase [Thermoleophilia bacterium SCSIO 60948]|nr:sulfotransferase [Thermoleophilia bacterium SCSIO 60948]
MRFEEATDAGREAPLIIVGTGRCGSTLLHRLLAEHEQLAWISPYNEVMPERTSLGVLSNLYRLPLSTRVRHAKVFPKPYEAYRFWEHYMPGFSRRESPLEASDVPEEGARRVRVAADRLVRAQGGRRLLVKVTGWSRMAYFDRVFPGATFIHLKRDPRSVVSSWMQAGWLNVTRAPDTPGWEWGAVPGAYMAAWSELGGDAIMSAALKIRLDLDDIEANDALLPNPTLETSYEDLVGAPVETLRGIVRETGLDWTPAFERRIARRSFYDSRERWREHLSDEDGDRVVEFMNRANSVRSTPSMELPTVDDAEIEVPAGEAPA